jgi:hypothetical protein
VVVYINDVELERAKVAVKAIERSALLEEPDLIPDALWKVALSRARGWNANQWSCREIYKQLSAMSPTSLYPIQKP